MADACVGHRRRLAVVDELLGLRVRRGGRDSRRRRDDGRPRNFPHRFRLRTRAGRRPRSRFCQFNHRVRSDAGWAVHWCAIFCVIDGSGVDISNIAAGTGGRLVGRIHEVVKKAGVHDRRKRCVAARHRIIVIV